MISPDHESVQDGVRALVDACASAPDSEDEELHRLLVHLGYDPELADRLVVFSPLGFSGVLLHDCRLSTDYQVMDFDGRVVAQHPLTDEPTYVAARTVALGMASEPACRDKFLGLASRCSRVHAVNQALHAGSQLKDLVFAPTVVFLGRFPAAPSSHGSTRPWWRFWG